MRRARTPTLAALVAALALAGACAPDGPAGATAPPVTSRGPSLARRVVLLSCDTLRADRLGAYGSERGLTPHLDALAARSLLAEEAYACAPVTGPSLSSLMSGLLPDEVGMSGGNGQLMPAEVLTLAELSRQAGLATGAVVSNWVLRRRQGAPPDVGLPQGFDHYDDRMTHGELNRDHFERLAPETTAAAIAWLESLRAARTDRFLLWAHYQDPHGPYTPPAPFAERFALPLGDDEPALPAGATHKGKGQIPAYQVLGDERRPSVYRARYDAEVAAFDAALGELLDWLEGAGWMDGTLLVFTADHGESLGESGYWFCHGENVQREVVRVPLLLKLPGGGAGSGRIAFASHLDLFPTIAEALGLPVPEARRAALRGRSLLGTEPPRPVVHTLGRAGTTARWEGISDGRWRLVAHRGRAPRLHDIVADPGETRDVLAEQPQAARRLGDALASTLRGMQWREPWRGAALSEADSAAFDAMGYTGGAGDGEDDDG